MLYKETIGHDLLEILSNLTRIEELFPFRLVGGTAIALQLGHRKSVDIDLFSNEKTDKTKIRQILNKHYPSSEIFVTESNIQTEIKGVRVELYDNWMIPFRCPAMQSNALRLAGLEDLAAFKLSAITGRREKKDYIDLYFLFNELGTDTVLKNFHLYEPLMSPKSVSFALVEIETAIQNNSPMPDMLKEIEWRKVKASMIDASKKYLTIVEQSRTNKTK